MCKSIYNIYNAIIILYIFPPQSVINLKLKANFYIFKPFHIFRERNGEIIMKVYYKLTSRDSLRQLKGSKSYFTYCTIM